MNLLWTNHSTRDISPEKPLLTDESILNKILWNKFWGQMCPLNRTKQVKINEKRPKQLDVYLKRIEIEYLQLNLIYFPGNSQNYKPKSNISFECSGMLTWFMQIYSTGGICFRNMLLTSNENNVPRIISMHHILWCVTKSEEKKSSLKQDGKWNKIYDTNWWRRSYEAPEIKSKVSICHMK